MLGAGFIVFLIALMTSTFTWMIAWAWYRWRLEAEMQRMIGELQDEFQRRVKAGVAEAAIELLPQLREQVNLGFQDAMRGSQAAGLVENAAGVVNVGGEIVAGGLSALFGIKPKR
jgi:hypothetical protein